MNFIQRFCIFCSWMLSFSCNQSETQIQQSLNADFQKQKHMFNSVIQHVVANYFGQIQYRTLNRLQFVLGEKTYQRQNIFSDSIISSKLENTSVSSLSFEKVSLCLDKYEFDEVRFKLDVIGSPYQYYYVYTFCPQTLQNVDGPNFKSIIIDPYWSIDMEKS